MNEYSKSDHPFSPRFPPPLFQHHRHHHRIVLRALTHLFSIITRRAKSSSAVVFFHDLHRPSLPSVYAQLLLVNTCSTTFHLIIFQWLAQPYQE